MRLLKRASHTLPVRQNTNSHNNSEACQWFLPCNGLVSGNLVEAKQGCIVPPQSGAVYEYDADRYAVRSTALGNAATAPFLSGSFPTLPVDKKALFMYAGYLRFPDGATSKTMRVALGDTNNFLGGGNRGWGMSDGISSGAVGHSVISSDSETQNGSYYEPGGPLFPQTPMGELIETALGAEAYFYRYAIYDPTVLLQASAAVNVDTGVAIVANNTETTLISDVGEATFAPAFRSHGVFLTGVGLWYFDAIPSDKDLAMLTMANYWRDGNKVVWPWS